MVDYSLIVIIIVTFGLLVTSVRSGISTREGKMFLQLAGIVVLLSLLWYRPWPKFTWVNSNVEVEKEPTVRFISKGEAECKRVLEELFGVPFENVRPEFLVNPETGRRLELDCYNPALRLAVEYQGSHHYNPNRSTPEQFAAQCRRDGWKVEACRSQGIWLIVVPECIKIEHIKTFIVGHLSRDLRSKIVLRSTP